MAKKTDWKKIQKEYVTTKISQREIARKYKVSSAQIANHSKKENWVEKRKQYQSRVYAKSVKKQEEKDIDHLMKVKSSADKMGKVIEKVMEKSEKMSINIGYAQEIKDLSTALKNLTTVIRDLYDIPNMKEQTAMDIARKKIELDKSRTATGEDGEEYGVLMLADVKEEDNEKCVVETTAQTD